LTYLESGTSFDRKRLQDIVDALPLQLHGKGDILLRQGDLSSLCFFVIKGCLRQYFYDEKATEQTVEFYTEGEFFADFGRKDQQTKSDFFITCLDDSALIVGKSDFEQNMYEVFPELKELNLQLLERKFGKVQHSFAAFKASTPEERYTSLKNSRPDLLTRVPQHQIASYLGITLESLSRIKKRLSRLS